MSKICKLGELSLGCINTTSLYVDYIKRIRPAEPEADNEKMELNRIMNELKALAVILDIPVITAHQINRAGTALIDQAVRSGKGDGLKAVGREHIGSQLVADHINCLIDRIISYRIIKRHVPSSLDTFCESILHTDIQNTRIHSWSFRAPEAKGVMDLITEALQFGFITPLKDEYIDLLDDIDLNSPGSFKELVNRLFLVSKSLMSGVT